MDLLSNLRKLLGIQQQSINKPTTKTAATPIQHQEQPQVGFNPNNITPGYQPAALNYEREFDRGNVNSPYIVGRNAIDPANFGYAPDGGQQPTRRGVLSFDELLRRR